jgi:hypothetical protein
LTKITVWHRMTVIGTITDETTLLAFDRMWSEKIKQPKSTKVKFRYSFDLQRLHHSGKPKSVRWVYSPEGWTKVMVLPAFGHIPVYRVATPDALNRLVGIDSAAPDPEERVRAEG